MFKALLSCSACKDRRIERIEDALSLAPLKLEFSFLFLFSFFSNKRKSFTAPNPHMLEFSFKILYLLFNELNHVTMQQFPELLDV